MQHAIKTLGFDDAVRALSSRGRDGDDDCRVASFELLLRDRYSLQRILTPCRGDTCEHDECFDLASYAALNARASEPLCPVCSRGLPPARVHVDEMVVRLLAAAPGAPAVELARDGRWRAVGEADPSGAEAVDVDAIDVDEDGHEQRGAAAGAASDHDPTAATVDHDYQLERRASASDTAEQPPDVAAAALEKPLRSDDGSDSVADSDDDDDTTRQLVEAAAAAAAAVPPLAHTDGGDVNLDDSDDELDSHAAANAAVADAEESSDDSDSDVPLSTLRAAAAALAGRKRPRPTAADEAVVDLVSSDDDAGANDNVVVVDDDDDDCRVIERARDRGAGARAAVQQAASAAPRARAPTTLAWSALSALPVTPLPRATATLRHAATAAAEDFAPHEIADALSRLARRSSGLSRVHGVGPTITRDLCAAAPFAQGTFTALRAALGRVPRVTPEITERLIGAARADLLRMAYRRQS